MKENEQALQATGFEPRTSRLVIRYSTTWARTHLSVLDEQGDEVDVPLVGDVEDDAVLLRRLELDAEAGSLLDAEDPVELQVGVLLSACNQIRMGITRKDSFKCSVLDLTANWICEILALPVALDGFDLRTVHKLSSNEREKNLGRARIWTRAAKWEAQMLPTCFAAPNP